MAVQPSGLVSDSLLEKIDSLFACNVGEYVDLPQLVVVGDQSSGKSSVLEGLTELPFPRDSGLCTRFATQITFRRSKSEESKTSISVIPAKNSGPEYSDRLKNWQRTNLHGLDVASFKEIMEEVADVMEIDGEGKTKTFSEDVLRLELSGKNQPHFSVIDVPGIFKKTTQGVTTKEDMAMVSRMVHGYMSNPRSVILAVIPSNVDVATQEILDKAEELDPDGIRTLGILTKPDLVDKGAETAVINMVKGRSHVLQLGWHLLKNPGQNTIVNSAVERRVQETDFFKNAPWNELDKDKIGTEELKKRLQAILADHIRREFPKVKIELNNRLRSAQENLRELGPKRQTQAEHNLYMTDVATQFERIVGLAVRSDYSQMDLFDNDESLRLATKAVNRGEAFARAMAKTGHSYQFDSGPDSNPSEGGSDETDADQIDWSDSDSLTIKTRYESDHSDILDITGDYTESVNPVHHRGIIAWVEEVYLSSRGFELGTFDSSLLAVTMKHQAAKWKDIALGYVSDIITLVHNCVLRILKQVAPNARVQGGIKDLLLDKLREKYANALAHARFLIKVELEGTPATLNHYFNHTLEKCRQERLREQLKDKTISGCEHGEVVRVDDIAQNHPLGNVDHVVRDIHDILRSYYKLARKRFVDNVRMQVCDYFLVTGPETPLALFSPRFVAAMSTDQLEDVAGEDPRVLHRRATLEKEIKELEEGRKIL